MSVVSHGRFHSARPRGWAGERPVEGLIRMDAWTESIPMASRPPEVHPLRRGGTEPTDPAPCAA